MFAKRFSDSPCSKCGEADLTKFAYVKQGKNVGRRYLWCMACVKVYRKNYRSNPNSIRGALKYRETHRKVLSARTVRWKCANRQKANAIAAKWTRNNPEKVAATDRIQRHKRRAHKFNSWGQFTNEEWCELKALYNFTCLKCGLTEPTITLTVDHVIPLSKDGRNTIDNIQPLCSSCNCKKYTDDTDYRPLWKSALS